MSSTIEKNVPRDARVAYVFRVFRDRMPLPYRGAALSEEGAAGRRRGPTEGRARGGAWTAYPGATPRERHSLDRPAGTGLHTQGELCTSLGSWPRLVLRDKEGSEPPAGGIPAGSCPPAGYQPYCLRDFGARPVTRVLVSCPHDGGRIHRFLGRERFLTWRFRTGIHQQRLVPRCRAPG